MKLPPPFVEQKTVLAGVAASPGISIGKAHLVDRSKVEFLYQSLISEPLVEEEVERFEKAVDQAREQLEQIKSGMNDELMSHAFNSWTPHLLLLKDRLIHDTTVEMIREGTYQHAEWALAQAVEQAREPIFQDQKTITSGAGSKDIEDVTDRILNNLVGRRTRRPAGDQGNGSL